MKYIIRLCSIRFIIIIRSSSLKRFCKGNSLEKGFVSRASRLPSIKLRDDFRLKSGLTNGPKREKSHRRVMRNGEKLLEWKEKDWERERRRRQHLFRDEILCTFVGRFDTHFVRLSLEKSKWAGKMSKFRGEGCKQHIPCHGFCRVVCSGWTLRCSCQ